MAIKTYQDFIKVASEMKDKYRDLSLFTFIRNKGSAIETTNAEGKKPPTTRYRQFNRKNEDSRIFYSEWLKTAAEKEEILMVAALCFVSPPETGLFPSLSPVARLESPPPVTDDDRNNPVPSFRRRTCPRSWANLRQHGVPETEGKRAACRSRDLPSSAGWTHRNTRNIPGSRIALIINGNLMILKKDQWGN